MTGLKKTEIMDQLLDLIRDTNKSAKQVLSEFTESQKLTWPLADANFKGLEKVKEKNFQFAGFQVKVQFNPERIRSSAAKVDKQSIAERKCFLCNENRPPEQNAIAFDDQFVILVNPFPIFRKHFTISSNTHVDQRFLSGEKTLLELAEAMEGFTVFYNGPECGASAPDHLHFQAGESSFMPITSEFELLKQHSGRLLFSGNETQVWVFDNYLRKMISVETSSMEEGLTVIDIFYRHFEAMQPEKVEPMINALCSCTAGKWIIHLFPRKTHRPTQFFDEGAGQILISPASVDFGGVFITPRCEDFDKITKEDVVDIFTQVCVNQDSFQKLTENIRKDLANFD
jgi:ATP adenylyltransferase/5',5'''-P-1,P-4-tetraphosphate phosphorylase II